MLQARLPKSVDNIIMVLGVVAGLKNRELVMTGVVGGDCRDTWLLLVILTAQGRSRSPTFVPIKISS